MINPLRSSCLPGLAIAALCAGSALSAQTVDGVVVTEGSGEPVAGATAVLLDTLYARHATAVTDDEGRFVLEAPGAGAYVILLERPEFASELSPPITLPAGETVEFRMEVEGRTVERMAALSEARMRREALTEAVLERCGGDVEAEGRAALTGAVRDSTSGVALPGAGVVLEWEEEGEPRRMEVRAGVDGGYTFCGAPAGDTVTVAVLDVGGGAPLAALVMEAGVVHLLDLPVDVATFGLEGSAQAMEARVVGRVTEHGTGRPVEGAAVRLGEDGPTAVTGATGYFHIDGVEPGSYVLRVEHLGYGSQEQVVRARPGRILRADVTLAAEALELEGIEVSVESRAFTARMSGFYERMELGEARGTGDFIVREEIELRGSQPVSALLRGRRGIDVRRTRTGYIPVFRNAATAYGMCRPVLYVDGHRIGKSYDDIDMVPTPDIEAIEVYRGAAEMPGEFADSDSGCGVIAIWTR